MQELISDCGHYVDVRSGVVECLLKRVSVDCALNAWYTRVVLLNEERRLESTILTSLTCSDHLSRLGPYLLVPVPPVGPLPWFMSGLL